MEKSQLVQTFGETIDELLAVISSFDDAQLNRVPFEGSWTAGQVAQHLFKSYAGVPAFLVAPVRATERDPAQFIEPITKSFLDFSTRFEAPDFILPERRHYNKAELLAAIDGVRRSIIATALQLDLTFTCTGFALPGIGEMTRMEWINFMIVHTKRHIHQLKNISRSA